MLMETEAQKAVIRWARGTQTSFGMNVKHPELDLLYRIPNDAPYQAKNRYALAAHYRAMGQLPGMPDLCLPVARKGYSALYLEMKREDGGNISKAQERIGAMLVMNGNLVRYPKGEKAAIQFIEEYLS